MKWTDYAIARAARIAADEVLDGKEFSAEESLGILRLLHRPEKMAVEEQDRGNDPNRGLGAIRIERAKGILLAKQTGVR